jgi:hypothetical protein
MGGIVLFIVGEPKTRSMQPIGKIFMEMTRYNHLSRADQFRGLHAPSLEKPVPKDAKFISLPRPAEISVPNLELRLAIESRRSIREYAVGTQFRDVLPLTDFGDFQGRCIAIKISS